MDGKKILPIAAIGEMVMAVVIMVYTLINMDNIISVSGVTMPDTTIDVKKIMIIMYAVFFGIRFVFGLIGLLVKGKAKVFIIVLGVLLVMGSIPSFSGGTLMGILLIIEFLISLAFLISAINIKINE